MIRLRRPREVDVLSLHTRRDLVRRQVKAKTHEPGSKEIGKAWAAFSKAKAKTEVASALDAYTHAKCAYCEQVAAEDIEHFYPKSKYPRRMFKWANFLRACKNCNLAKRHHFPTQAGKPLLIDPCAEDPLEFFRLDGQTGKMALNPNEPQHTRAKTTRDLLGLDDEPLSEERRQKLGNVVYLLAKAVNETPVSPQTKTRLREELTPHRPWLGIVRQLLKHPGGYEELVTAAMNKLPEIRVWAGDLL